MHRTPFAGPASFTGPEAEAARRPQDVALIEGSLVLTWAEWDERANRLAEALARRGIGPDDRVGVGMPVRLEWFVANAALGKLGATQVAVNYRLAPPELAHIARDSGMTAAIADLRAGAAGLEALRGAGVPLVVDAADTGGETPSGAVAWSDLLADAEAVPRTAAAPAVLIVYTSGTTGAPKGAVRAIPRADPETVACYTESVRYDDASAGPTYRALITMPLHHAAGPGHATRCLSCGGVAVLQRRFQAEETLALMERHHISHWHAVPTMLSRVMALPEDVRTRYDISALRYLSVGAAPVPHELKERAMAYFGSHVLHEGYGCTEASMIAGMRPHEHRRKPGAAGRPFRHVSVRITDADGRELPTGEIGEIWARTPRMITGYLNHPPLGPDRLDADGHFRTGDLGRFDEDGYLHVTGRATDMIIAGGVNIYPAEIEAVLRAHPAVQDAAVVGVPDADLGERVAAFVELAPGAAVTADELAAFAAPELGAFKRPRHYTFVTALPRNAMGKVLKHELRARHAADHAAPTPDGGA